MSDETTSGNRWEPTDGDAPAGGGTATDELDRDATHASVPADAAPAPAVPARGWRERLGEARTRTALIAAATFVVGGAAGFVAGHAVGGSEPAGRPGQQGQFTPGQRPDGGGFGRDRDGDGFGGPGADRNEQQNGQQQDQDGTGASGNTA